MSTVFGNLLFLLGYAFPLVYILLKINNRDSLKNLVFFSSTLLVCFFVFNNTSWIYPLLLKYFSDDVIGPAGLFLILSAVATPIYLTSKYSKYMLPRINRVSLILWATLAFFFAIESAIPLWIFIQTVASFFILLLCFKKEISDKRARYSLYILFVSTLLLVTLIQTWGVISSDYPVNTISNGIALYYLLASFVFLALHTWQNESWGKKVSFNDVRIDVETTTQELVTQKRNILQLVIFLMFVCFLYINTLYSLLSFEVIIGITFVLMSITLNKYSVIKN